MTHTKFVVLVVKGGDECGVDGKTHLFYIRLSGSQQKNFCGLNHHFLKKGVDQCKFRCSSFAGSDLCNMDGKQSHFMVNSPIIRSP